MQHDSTYNNFNIFRSENEEIPDLEEDFWSKFRCWITNLSDDEDHQKAESRAEESKHTNIKEDKIKSQEDGENHHYWRWNIKKLTEKKSTQNISTMIVGELGEEWSFMNLWQNMVNSFQEMGLNPGNTASYPDGTAYNIDEGSYLNKEIFTPNIHEMLVNREKGEKLTFMQKEFIYNLVKDQVKPIEVIKSIYSISNATMKRILHKFKTGDTQDWIKRDQLGYKVFKSEKIKRLATGFVLKQETSFVSRDVWNFVKEFSEFDIDHRWMTKFLNCELGMSFKKASSRLFSVDVKRIHQLKVLFSVILAKHLSKHTLLINFDESSFSRLTKRWYTWLIKGAPGSMKNIQLKGSLNLVSAIASSGSTYSAISIGTMKKEGTKLFLHKLIKEIESTEGVTKDKFVIILDNASWHQSKLVTDFMESNQINHIFLPQYSPDLAPVETFFANLKNRIARRKWKIIDLAKEEGTKMITEEIQNITAVQVKRSWWRFYKRIKFLLTEARAILST